MDNSKYTTAAYEKVKLLTKEDKEEEDLSHAKNDVTQKDDVTKKQQYKWYNVNWSMVSTKLAYFFECGRRIGFAPNLVLFLISIGLNKAESGFIVGLR